MTLTPAERRAVVLVVGLLALGTLWDLRPPRWRSPHAPPAEPGPTAAEIGGAGGTSAAAAAARDTFVGAILDLNRATLGDLDGLPGVGPVLAARILEQRRRQGAFHDVRDLRAVK